MLHIPIMKHIILALPLALAACVSVPDTQPGQVHSFNGDSVVIRGGIPAGFAATAAPNSAMIAQAQAICPGATYAGASGVPNELDVLFDYLFIC